MFEQYSKEVSANERVGSRMFKDCLRLLCVPTKQQVGLSDRFTDWLRLVEEMRLLLELLDTVVDEWSLDAVRPKLMCLSDTLPKCVNYMKYSYKREVAKSSQNVYLCMQYGLGSEDCTEHEHVALRGSACDYFAWMPQLIELLQTVCDSYDASAHQLRLFKKVSNALADLQMLGVHEWLRFPRHIMRTVCQNNAIDALTDGLGSNELLVVMDYKQKILPDSSEAAQADWFARAGMSLLGCWLIWKNDTDNTYGTDGADRTDGDEQTERNYHFLDLIPNNVHTQNAANLLVALEVLLQYIKERLPMVTKVHFQSDNASNFSNMLVQAFALVMNNTAKYPHVVSWVYTGELLKTLKGFR